MANKLGNQSNVKAQGNSTGYWARGITCTLWLTMSSESFGEQILVCQAEGSLTTTFKIAPILHELIHINSRCRKLNSAVARSDLRVLVVVEIGVCPQSRTVKFTRHSEVAIAL